MGTRERRDRSDKCDSELLGLFLSATSEYGIKLDRVALSAVGGYGRGELSPGSDLDLLILHDGSLAQKVLSDFVNAFLYPLWNSGRAIDHSVRTSTQTREIANEDIKVAQGLLDIRLIAGASSLVEAVASDALYDWWKNSKKNLPKVRAAMAERHQRSGELAFLLEPDLKETRGGLRDLQALHAIALTGAEVALDRVTSSGSILANVRDALHEVSGKSRDQLLFTEQDKVAAHLGYVDADALMLELAKAARSVDYVMDVTLHKLDIKKERALFRREGFEVVGKGVISSHQEISVAQGYGIETDALLGLRAAATAAQLGLPLSVAACTALAKLSPELPIPWPRQSREDLVALIGAGEFMVGVFESLDQEGLIEKWIPEWGHVRFLPQRNVLHRHTVDRHMLETAVRAAKLTRTVHRPDLLLIAALLHDIGKGFPNLDHSEYGAELMAKVAVRLGFEGEDVEVLARLVKNHLLLSAVATRRDLDDPQTIEFVIQAVRSPEELELLHALSISDGEATGRTAWSEWKAKLVADLVRRVHIAMTGGVGIRPAEPIQLTSDQLDRLSTGALSVSIQEREDIYEVEILSPDQVGLLSVVAGIFSISRFNVRSARTRTIESSAAMKWIVSLDSNAQIPTAAQLTDLLEKALAGEIDIAGKIDERVSHYRKNPGIPVPPPVVTATNDIATNATVVEVRMHDRPGVLYSVARAISRFGVDIRAAIVSTLGAEAFDTLYVTDFNGSALSEERAKLLANQVESYLLTQ
jgi:[protein-PII] uridylyltransferase